MASAAAAAQRKARGKAEPRRAIEPNEHTHTQCRARARALCVCAPRSMCGHFVPWSARSAADSVLFLNSDRGVPTSPTPLRCYWASLQSVYPGAATDKKAKRESSERERGRG